MFNWGLYYYLATPFMLKPFYCKLVETHSKRISKSSVIRMATLFLSLILTVCFVLRVTDGQGEVTERVCVSYITSVLI